MLAVALLGFLGGGFWLFSRQRPPALLAELMEIHTGLARSELPLTYPSSDAEMLQRWLGQRLPFRPFIPRVEGTGFDLLGARTLSLLNREGAVLLLAKEGHKVSLISLPEGGHIQTFGKKKTRKGMQFWIFAQGIYSVVLWAEQGLLYAMVSDEDVDDLLEYARLCVLQMRAPT
jgi:anti-sigma factor RsiW